MKKTSRIVIQCSNPVSKKQTLKGKDGELWITREEDGWVFVWLTVSMADGQVRGLLIALGAKLPVIKF